MRVGLVRHFPVCQDFPSGFLTAADLEAWQASYNKAEITAGDTDLGGIEWQACLASDVPRARLTAETVFAGPIEFTPLLREANYTAFPTGNLRLPATAWKWILRLCWMTGHRSQRANCDEFKQRVRAAAKRLSGIDRDTMVVSHAGMMFFLSIELRRLGFTGPKLRLARHATAYVYSAPATTVRATSVMAAADGGIAARPRTSDLGSASVSP
jgi:hypothetical protein